MRSVEISLPTGGLVTEMASVAGWHATRTGPVDLNREDAEPITVDELLEERHHKYYGRPWALGRAYVDHLLARGIDREQPVLDFGCGAGRAGIWLIPELARGCYHGVDSHLRALQAFARYEVPLHGLAAYEPRLMLANEFEVDAFGVAFDTVLDFYVTHHLGPEGAEAAYRRIRASMRPGGRVFLSGRPILPTDLLETVGFELTDVRSVSYDLLAGSSVQATDEWHELTAVERPPDANSS